MASNFSLVLIFFFFSYFENSWVFVFSILGFYFSLMGLLDIFFFPDFSSNYFGLFFLGVKVEQINFFSFSQGVFNFD